MFKRSTVTIVKDAQPDSEQEFTFSHNIGNNHYGYGYNLAYDGPVAFLGDDYEYEMEGPEDFTLVDDGVNTEEASKTFEDIKVGPKGMYYGVSEHEVEGWIEHDFSCDNEEVDDDKPRLIRFDENSEEGEYDHYFHVGPGEDVTCTFVNQETLINIVKSNNRPNPTVNGDQVTYTLVVTVPEEAADVLETVVTDLPPENFEYVPGSWTAESSERGDLKAANVTPEPTYASPGDWNLGQVIGGETIVLTYLATIQDNVTPGVYPDIAFVQGVNEQEGEVLGNITVASTPFVGTEVAIVTPSSSEFAAPAVLAETGFYFASGNGSYPSVLTGLNGISI